MIESLISILLIAVVLAILVQRKKSSRIAKKDAAQTLALQKTEHFRTVRMQQLEPVVELLVVGSLLLSDASQNSVHLALAAIGAIVGIGFGYYRARHSYIRSAANFKGVVLRRGATEYLALIIVMGVKVITETQDLPHTGPVNLVITALLALLVAESITRSVMIMRYYKRDTR